MVDDPFQSLADKIAKLGGAGGELGGPRDALDAVRRAAGGIEYDAMRRAIGGLEYGDLERRVAERLGTFRAVDQMGIVDAARHARDQLGTQRAVDQLGIVDAARQARELYASGHISAFEEAQKHTDFNAQFRLPSYEDATRYFSALQASQGHIQAFMREAGVYEHVHDAIREMTQPWLRTSDELRSMHGFVGLQGVGALAAARNPFAEHEASILRSALGDWRDSITVPEAALSNLIVRSEFYRARGFDEALTDLPADAFDEAVDIAGLRGEPPPLIVIYAPPVPATDDLAEEAGFVRTNRAHDWLTRFETVVRKFIDDEMARAFGADWPRHRLPNGMYDAWVEKHRKAGDRGRGRPLIAYADLTDYLSVILRADNWRQVFARFFLREETIREAFQRLYPFRLDTMHARLISLDDELFLYVEIRRIMSRIGH
ncbi:MAG: hypothetical protein ACOY4R_14215 [Pseudomonadota bacterium]